MTSLSVGRGVGQRPFVRRQPPQSSGGIRMSPASVLAAERRVFAEKDFGHLQ